MNIYQGNINPCGSYCLVLMEPTVCLAPNDLSTKLKYKIKFKETTFQHLKQASSKYHFILATSRQYGQSSSSSAVVPLLQGDSRRWGNQTLKTCQGSSLVWHWKKSSTNCYPIYCYPICCQDISSQPWLGLQSIRNEIRKTVLPPI